MGKKSPDRTCYRMRLCDPAQLPREVAETPSLEARRRLDADHRHGPAPWPHAHQRGSAYQRVLIENCLARFSEKRARRRLDAMGLPPAEPDSAGLILPADIAHAVPEAIPVGDLGQARR